jgi:HK97 family phage major capsid protein
MNYVQRGAPIPADLGIRVAEYRQANPLQYRAGEAIDTTDTGAAIPLTIMREIINTVRKKYGNLYDKVTKLSVQGGVEFPIGELQADFEWITESTVSPEKEIGKLGTISFKYNTAEIRIAQTFLSSILTMEAFESKITEVIALAYRKAMDIGIVKGTGNGQMLGILNDIRVTGQVGHTIAMTAAEINNWTAWRKKFFAKLPLGYRDGEFIFSMATVDAYLETMADSNNNPIFRQATGLEVNDGDAADPNGRFFGRRISIVEPDIITDFNSASSGDVIGIYWQPSEYAINENFGFMMRRYFDENRNKWINKALTVVDGKVLNPNGYYLITKA